MTRSQQEGTSRQQMEGVTPEEPVPDVVMQGGTEESILAVLRQLKAEMMEMKKERERDALELSALRRENVGLREEIRTHVPSLTTPVIQDQGESSALQEKSRQVYQSVTRNDRDDLVNRSPFIHHILEAKLPDNWRRLVIDKYDGTSDPGEHVDIFTTQFATSQPHPLTSLALVNIRQEKGESLRAFMERFGKVTLSIHNLEPAVAMHLLTTALKPRPFVNSLYKKPLIDLDELRSRAAKYMQMEELSEYRNQVRMDQGSNSKNVERRETFKARQGNDRGNKLERLPRGPKYPSYTTLNTNRSRVLDQALATEILRMPRRANTPPRADKSPIRQPNKGRDRHPDLPKRSDDKKFERHRSRSREPPARRFEQEKYPKRVINTIAGGFAGGGLTHSARKRHLRHVRSDDPMVISVDILNCTVKKTLIDQGSSADILYRNTFKQLGISDQELKEYHEPLVSFSGERVNTKGCIDLYTSFGSEHEGKRIRVTYLVVHANTSYNILFGRPSLNKLKAIVSTLHFAMKFPSEKGRIVTVHANQKTARECYFASLRLKPFHGNNRDVNIVSPRLGKELDVELDPRVDEEYRVEPNENKQPFQLGAKPEQVAYLGISLNVQEKKILQKMLLDNADLFAWTASDMLGIDPTFLCHHLSVYKWAKPVAQKKRKIGGDRAKAANEETSKLIQADFIREVRYSTWLANIVMVKKASGKWRMCTDFTDLNKACPKDAYPLPNIDTLVDGVAGHKILSFLDAYSRYNQIRMYPPDEEKTAFITNSANFCYRVMPFGLKNAGATYQRLMNKIFEKQVGKCMEVYVDDMVIKSLALKQHLDHLEEVFGEARKHGMRFNPEKCTFGVAGGKFLGFMLSERGIEANPDKCRAIIDMASPRNVKDVQRLTGRIAALARFLPIMTERSRPFIELLKKSKKFAWSNECEDAFVQYKHVLAAPPVLIKPTPNQEMIVYLAVSDHAISSVLLQETPEPNPVYFVSRTLQGPESRYQLMEKVVLALVYTARRLRHYFQSHRMVVCTDCPMAKILRKPELAGRLVAWTIELSQFDIHFENRRPLKAQVLADFINEFTTQHNTTSDMWNLHVDGSSNQLGSGAGVILEGPNAFAIEQSIRFGFKASNNQAEYEALLAGLRLAKEMGVKRITAWSDSKIVTEQVNDSYQIRDSVMLKYYQEVKKIKAKFEEVCIQYTSRNMNARADRLAKLASQRKPGQLQSVVHQQITQPSVAKQECMDMENSSHNWMTPLIRYLTDGSLPQDTASAKKIKAHAAKYLLLGKELYRRGISTPMLKCLDNDQANYVMREIHEGICGTHSGRRTMAAKVLRAGYYWPTITQDCHLFVKKCIPCQQHGPHLRQHADTLRHISSP
ncbi:uncharacterized protein LOC113851996 [Abrus precatorius]|uniref:Uncharacterized protein LOC113851996 n=1 Tax=Abrus precatorius TaxID=3816 RepID=A0A8B8K2Q1_ABRPR|nr:uncharacterized protein LOC113851996 [Abrus precatorius]